MPKTRVEHKIVVFRSSTGNISDNIKNIRSNECTNYTYFFDKIYAIYCCITYPKVIKVCIFFC